MGFDFNEGRFDRSVHPFTGGAGPFDVRITTRYDEKNFMDAVMGTVHEVGHALYEQGLNREHDGLPVQRALSMGVHESQSLFWERYVGQSPEFWSAAFPNFCDAFPDVARAGVVADDVYRFVNKAKAGFIRVDADELTYSMHVVLRFEIERELIAGRVDVADLPNLWREKMRELLGVTPETDALGVLQDVHWSDGSFGYFPSYTLGAMYACQFYAKAREEIDGFDALVARGSWRPCGSGFARRFTPSGRCTRRRMRSAKPSRGPSSIRASTSRTSTRSTRNSTGCEDAAGRAPPKRERVGETVEEDETFRRGERSASRDGNRARDARW